MITYKFYNVFVTQIRIFSLYCASPYKWDDALGRIRPTSTVRIWVWKCLALIQIRYAIFLIVRLFQSLADEEYEPSAKLAIFGWVALHNCSSVWYIPLFFKRTELMQVFNFMIDFEVKYIEIPPFTIRNEKEESLIYYLHLVSTILTVIIPYVIPFVFWFYPCEPQFLSSMFLSCPADGQWTWTLLILKLLFLLVEIIASQQMVLHTIFMIFTCYYLTIKCLGGYLEYIRTIRLKHFRFKPIFMRRMTLYRQLEILTAIINECFHTTLLLFKMILALVIMTLIYFFVKLFRPYANFPLVGKICIPLSLISALTVLYLVYGESGKIYRNSQSITQQWRSLGKIRHRNRLQWVRQNFQAIQPLTIRIGGGSFAFIRPCTWLQTIYFCAKHAVLLLIMSGDHLTLFYK